MQGQDVGSSDQWKVKNTVQYTDAHDFFPGASKKVLVAGD